MQNKLKDRRPKTPELAKELQAVHDVFPEGYYKQEYDKFIESLINHE